MSMTICPIECQKFGCSKRASGSIHQIQGKTYLLQPQSRYFPGIDLQGTIAQCLQIAYDRNTSAAIRNLRQRLSDTP